MHVSRLSFDKVPYLSHKDQFYQLHYDKLRAFIQFDPDLDGLKAALEQRQKFPVNRELLVDVLTDHYSKYTTSSIQADNIKWLRSDKTFTIITAHQPCLLGGPAYYFYKIFNTIHLSRKIKEIFPDYHFVPVFVNGSEDHDFDEIKSVNIFGKTLTWETNQTGSVGRFSIENLSPIVQQFHEILGQNEVADTINKTFTSALVNAQTYNDFVFRWINDIFKEFGLLVMNMDDKRLKQAFIPMLKKEIIEKPSEHLIQETQDKLSKFGFKPQAFARHINVFYINDQIRERIIYEDGNYFVNNSTLTFSAQEMIDHLESYPERFSPNVVLRPIYQEFSLPNIAYIGGGGEIAYWLERKSQFQSFGVFFPVLIRRTSVIMLNNSLQKSMQKFQLSMQDLMLDEDRLIDLYLEKTTTNDFHLAKEINAVRLIFEEMAVKAKNIDNTLEPVVVGESHKIIKTIENIEHRLKRSLKTKEDTQINQLKTLKNKLIPHHGLQERHDSFFQFWVGEKLNFLEQMISLSDPLAKDMLCIKL